MIEHGPNACRQMAAIADRLAPDHADPRAFLVELGHEVAGIARGRQAVLGLLAGGRSRLLGGGFRAELRDRSASQTRHFAGIARAVTLLGAERTEWLSVHVRRDAVDSPDGRLTTLAIVFASRLLEGELQPRGAGEWIRTNVCG